MNVVILRLPEVIRRTGLSRSRIYEYMKQDRFPKQVTLGDRAVGWVESEVDKWLEERVNERGAA